MKQLSFWDNPSLDTTNRVKAAMREALKRCSLSREQVVDTINRLAGQEGLATNGKAQKVTPALLDKWVSAGAHGHRIPFHYLTIFCHVVQSLLPIQALAAPLGCEVISREQRAKLEWAEAEIERRKLAKRAKQLSQEVGL